MVNYVLKRIFGSQNERYLRKVWPVVRKISGLEPEVSKLTDGQLRAKTGELRTRLKEGLKESAPYTPETAEDFETERYEKELKQKEKETLDEILPEAFAVVREAAKRFVGMRHFDTQLIGGMVLHQGKIAEMATGEGKTLVATLAAYLNALLGRGVHIVTVNDYLARRDREWMGPIYESLGLSVGVLQHDMGPQERQQAYACDITYGTNNEFGFDYLRDNMVTRAEHMAQREANFAIVDEVDSILIDEARTPLIISGPAEESTELYYRIDKIIPRLKKGAKDEATKVETGDFVVDEKGHNTYLTDEGEAKVIELLGIKDMHSIESMEYRHHVNQALRAHNNFTRDVDYIVKDGEVIIVDEFTGRLMPGRRWSDGLHQAVEAKEEVKIERENQTLATITLQNYFKMYRKLAGMTGTAETEAVEFERIYNLGVVVIPTNRPLTRTNHPDVIYKTEKEKFKAVCDEIEELHRKGRPVLVGTISIEKNERLGKMLKNRNIPHNILNAKYHELEAHIIAQAGSLGGVTIATNMAGRGTDILLGGNPDFLAKDKIAKLKASGKDLSAEEEKNIFEQMRHRTEEEHKRVVEAGGLHVLGTERHEARRIDNQLRGRSGRQGDPGSSRFYLSLEDDLMRIFGSDRISGIMTRLGMEEGQDIQHPLVSRAISTAQKRVEEHNFEIRKHVLEYDNVMNKQREIVYGERRKILFSEDLKSYLDGLMGEVVDIGLDMYLNKNMRQDEWDYDGLRDWLRNKFLIGVSDAKLEEASAEETRELVLGRLKDGLRAREMSAGGPETMGELEKVVLLHVIDSRWKDHLYGMDNLREGIGLRAYGQRDPLVEYQHEGYELFVDMIDGIKQEALEFLFKVRTVEEEKKKAGVFEAVSKEFTHEEKESFRGLAAAPQQGRDEGGGEPFAPMMPRGASSPHEQEKIAPYHRETPKVGRNDPCPCGSGKKYKKCCMK
ncbi:MAG: preprotein translocase subunit SecA [Candidatus Omnitrophica bacterium]|nr:preprotein translocase subunit SecA [Candidatus Omnitrophota bacterium]